MLVWHVKGALCSGWGHHIIHMGISYFLSLACESMLILDFYAYRRIEKWVGFVGDFRLVLAMMVESQEE